MILPVHDNILIIALPDPDHWAENSLIIRPESTKERRDQGIVRAIGPEVRNVKVGDYVMFSPYSGVVVDVEGEGDGLVMLREIGVIGIILVPDIKIEGLFIEWNGCFIPATSAYVSILQREAFEKIPRLAQITNKAK